MSDKSASKLVLDSLEIKNFRAFKHLQIEKLGRVNLVVGKNNVGKSCVLEALMLYAHRGYPRYIWDMLVERNESLSSKGERVRPDPTVIQERSLSIKYLFHGRKDVRENIEPIQIGQIASKTRTISVVVGWYVEDEDSDGIRVYKPLKPDQFTTSENAVQRLAVRVGSHSSISYALGSNASGMLLNKAKIEEIHCVFTSADGLSLDEVADYWDRVALSDLENDVVSALRIIAPNVEGVNLVGNGGLSSLRIPKVRLLGISDPIPLRSLGEGMNRILGIALALVNAKDGVLLLDEVDIGIHYSVLPALWKLIFKVAHRLNIQVFATSHSWDCIQAFQQAAADNENEEGVLIRLEERKAGVGAVVFDEHDLAIVTREQIEVR